MAKVLIVDDDVELCGLISDWLHTQYHDVESVHDGIEAADLLKVAGFDVIVLDWDLPGRQGPEVLHEFRDRGGTTPVIMLTAKNTIDEKERGFNLGADDYLTKPFSVKELSVRIKALLRRPPDKFSDILTSGRISLDPNKHVIKKEGVAVHLQPKDFALLEFLMRYPNRTFSADVLLARVWSSQSEASPDALRTAIKRIRKALDDQETSEEESIIRTVPRVGYTIRTE